jgi:ABC-type branched-subunit amino acid transport system substrate-binding protein
MQRAVPHRSVLASLLGVGALTAACTTSPSSGDPQATVSHLLAASTTPAVPSGPSPGVTSTSVTVGQVDDLSAPIPGLFKGAQDGTKAYFAYINSLGGVNGRKIRLDARDSAFQAGQVASETSSQVRNDFALVGGFSLLDGSEKSSIDSSRTPDVAFSLDPSLFSDPYVYSALPNPENYFPLGVFKWLKRKYPQAVKKVGIVWENATTSTRSAETAFENAMRAEGFHIVYDEGAGPLQTNFLPDVLAMKNDGVKMVFNLELPDNYAANLAKEMQQQDFRPIHIEGAAYSDAFLSLAGSAANGIYIEQAYALYLGQDAKEIPAIGLFTKWMKKVDPKPDFEIESIYGWTSAELFVQALRQAGNPPTRAGLVTALNKITSFNAEGLVPTDNPAKEIASDCFLLAQVQHGRIVRVAPSPRKGFYCGESGYLAAPGYHPVVRPTAS